MWYQRLSDRSMPAANVPSVGTIQPAITAAHATTATIFAALHACGDGGAGPATRPRASLVAIRPPARPTAIPVPSTAYSVKAPKVPSASEVQTSASTPITISARRAGAPVQAG